MTSPTPRRGRVHRTNTSTAAPAEAPRQEFLSFDEVAELLRISRPTLERYRAAGEFPEPDIKTKGRIIYRRSTIDKWIADNGPNGAGAADGD